MGFFVGKMGVIWANMLPRLFQMSPLKTLLFQVGLCCDCPRRVSSSRMCYPRPTRPSPTGMTAARPVRR